MALILTDFMSWPILILVAMVLACGGYLLVRHGVIDWKDALAGGGILGAILVLWTVVFGRKVEDEPDGDPYKPAPPTHDIDDIIDDYERQKLDPPGDDIHEKLHQRIRDIDGSGK